MKYAIAIALCVPLAVGAQASDPGCETAGKLLGALLKTKPNINCNKDAPQGAPSQPPSKPQGQQLSQSEAVAQGVLTRNGRNVDTPENLEVLSAKVRGVFQSADPLAPQPPQAYMTCDQALTPVRSMENIINSGYDELKRKCLAVAQAAEGEYLNRRSTALAQAKQQKAEAEASAQAEQERKKQADYNLSVAELRSGKRQPENCPQWMVAKGSDLDALKADVGHVTFEPPKGVGPFQALVEQIDGRTLVANDGAGQKSYMVLNVDAQAKVFGGNQLTTNSLLFGYGVQTGTRSLRLTNGAVKTAAVVQVHCVGVMIR